MTARLDLAPCPFEVTRTILGLRQKMEDGPIVPQIDCVRFPLARHIRFDPPHPVSGGSKPNPCSRQRRARHIQHRHTRETARDQPIHEAGISASNVEHSIRWCDSSGVQHRQRGGRL